MTKIVLLGLSLLLVSCASKPTLYPNDKLKSVGKAEAKKDTDQCIADAEKYLDSSEGKKSLKALEQGPLSVGPSEPRVRYLLMS